MFCMGAKPLWLLITLLFVCIHVLCPPPHCIAAVALSVPTIVLVVYANCQKREIESGQVRQKLLPADLCMRLCVITLQMA